MPQLDPPVSPAPASPTEAAPSCRPGCAACCIAPSISSPIPGHPNGKPAAVPCAQLDEHLRCRLFGRPERPAVCSSLQPSEEMCGDNREQALRWLGWLEDATASAPRPGSARAVRHGP